MSEGLIDIHEREYESDMVDSKGSEEFQKITGRLKGGETKTRKKSRFFSVSLDASLLSSEFFSFRFSSKSGDSLGGA